MTCSETYLPTDYRTTISGVLSKVTASRFSLSLPSSELRVLRATQRIIILFLKALELASVVLDGIQARPLPPDRFPEARVVDLSFRANAGEGGQSDGNSLASSKGEEVGARTIATTAAGGGGVDGRVGGNGTLGPEYRRSLRCPNPEETNSAVAVTFQVCCMCACERVYACLWSCSVCSFCFASLVSRKTLSWSVS